ncbi:MAG: hypothetical protein JWN46_730 [Acidimicrobiales bacterium]|nr:hypothetical protein [Acidimicrobiales bacterium]
MTATRRSGSRLDPDLLAALEEQRDFLLRSLDDLQREHDAGDLDDVDYQTLHDDYTSRAAEVLRAIEDERAAYADARRPPQRRRSALIALGIVAFAVVAGLLVARTIGAREPGQTAAGGIQVRQTPTQQAVACLPAGAGGTPSGLVDALKCLDKVLTDDPGNPTALTYKGWLLHLTSQIPDLPATVAQTYRRQSVAFVERAVRADPRLPDARAFRTVLAVTDGRYADAKRYLADLDALNPPAQIRQLIDQMDVPGQITRGLAAAGRPTTTTTAPH